MDTTIAEDCFTITTDEDDKLDDDKDTSPELPGEIELAHFTKVKDIWPHGLDNIIVLGEYKKPDWDVSIFILANMYYFPSVDGGIGAIDQEPVGYVELSEYGIDYLDTIRLEGWDPVSSLSNFALVCIDYVVYFGGTFIEKILDTRDRGISTGSDTFFTKDQYHTGELETIDSYEDIDYIKSYHNRVLYGGIEVFGDQYETGTTTTHHQTIKPIVHNLNNTNTMTLDTAMDVTYGTKEDLLCELSCDKRDTYGCYRTFKPPDMKGDIASDPDDPITSGCLLRAGLWLSTINPEVFKTFRARCAVTKHSAYLIGSQDALEKFLPMQSSYEMGSVDPNVIPMTYDAKIENEKMYTYIDTSITKIDTGDIKITGRKLQYENDWLGFVEEDDNKYCYYKIDGTFSGSESTYTCAIIDGVLLSVDESNVIKQKKLGEESAL
ncbi:hypothetical protein [Sulfurovum sp.]|uniref:hypothetical protein n=1 Tax=Sulfurovum sp. TaxID=1969726 RepID=UPI00260A969F|nr:hypothetical protein [Sulfurovum sp.]